TSAADYLRLADEPPAPGQGSPTLRGTDVLLTDVLSMDIRMTSFWIVQFGSLYDLGYPKPPYTSSRRPPNPVFGPAAVFDTWSNRADRFFDYRNASTTTTYHNYRIPFQTTSIRAIRVTLRVWDRQTQQTRQTSILRDL